jgi:hypothetical protein
MVKQEHAMTEMIGTIARNGSDSTDTTAQTIEHLRVKLKTLEALLTERQNLDAPKGRGGAELPTE